MNVNLLPVPYVPQLGIGADQHRNDCGAASASMLIQAYTRKKVSPDIIYNEANSGEDNYLSVNSVMQVMLNYGVRTEWRTNITFFDLVTMLFNKKPPLVLFNYGIFRTVIKTTLDKNFNGAHFAVITGLDTINFYINDPLWTDEKGKGIAVKHNDWISVWHSATLDGNPACGALIPITSIGDTVIEEPTTDVDILYKVRVVSKQGLNVRLSPNANLSNVVSVLPYGAGKDIYKETTVSNNKWGSINPSNTNWIALINNSVTLAERV